MPNIQPFPRRTIRITDRDLFELSGYVAEELEFKRSQVTDSAIRAAVKKSKTLPLEIEQHRLLAQYVRLRCAAFEMGEKPCTTAGGCKCPLHAESLRITEYVPRPAFAFETNPAVQNVGLARRSPLAPVHPFQSKAAAFAAAVIIGAAKTEIALRTFFTPMPKPGRTFAQICFVILVVGIAIVVLP